VGLISNAETRGAMGPSTATCGCEWPCEGCDTRRIRQRPDLPTVLPAELRELPGRGREYEQPV